MSNFIEVTTENGVKLSINVLAISGYTPVNPPNLPSHPLAKCIVTVLTADDAKIYVKDTYAAVTVKLDEAVRR